MQQETFNDKGVNNYHNEAALRKHYAVLTIDISSDQTVM